MFVNAPTLGRFYIIYDCPRLGFPGAGACGTYVELHSLPDCPIARLPDCESLWMWIVLEDGKASITRRRLEKERNRPGLGSIADGLPHATTKPKLRWFEEARKVRKLGSFGGGDGDGGEWRWR